MRCCIVIWEDSSTRNRRENVLIHVGLLEFFKNPDKSKIRMRKITFKTDQIKIVLIFLKITIIYLTKNNASIQATYLAFNKAC